MKPTIGRIVHYTADTSAEFKVDDPLYQPVRTLAAIVTQVSIDPDDMTVHLHVLTRDGAHSEHSVAFSDTPKAGCWSWPPRV